MSRRRRPGPTPRRRPRPPDASRRRLPLLVAGWVVVAVLAVWSALALRRSLPDALQAVAEGDRSVAFALGLVPWVVVPLSFALVQVVRHWWPVPVAFWVWLCMTPTLSRRGASTPLGDELGAQVPGYQDGWAAGVLLVVVPALLWAGYDKMRRRRRERSEG